MGVLNFNIVAITSAILWIVGLILLYLPLKKSFQPFASKLLIFTGTFLIFIYLIYLWVMLGHAPLRTLGQTRLWYSLFIASIGILIFYKWKMKWVPVFSIFFSTLFLLINFLNPENFDKSLMPALQSIWFVPHVIVYIFGYAMLAMSTIIALKCLYLINRNKFDKNLVLLADNTVYIGFAFLTLGLLFGALWAKEAWGQYWTWDPKEIWSFVTWLLYLLYIHFRFYHKNKVLLPLWLLVLSFLILLICWFGINYLPAAQTSIHTYRS